MRPMLRFTLLFLTLTVPTVSIPISCANPTATIRHTTDGSDPTEISTLYRQRRTR